MDGHEIFDQQRTIAPELTETLFVRIGPDPIAVFPQARRWCRGRICRVGCGSGIEARSLHAESLVVWRCLFSFRLVPLVLLVCLVSTGACSRKARLVMTAPSSPSPSVNAERGNRAESPGTDEMRSARAEPSSTKRSARPAAPPSVGTTGEALQPIGTTFVVIENRRSEQPPDVTASVTGRMQTLTPVTRGEERTTPLSAALATGVGVVLVVAGAIGLAWHRGRRLLP